MDEVGRLTRVLVKRPAEGFQDEAAIAAQWQRLHFTAPPDLARAIVEHQRFVELLRMHGAAVDFMPADPTTTLDSIYVRDAAIVTPAGVVLCRMGKASRVAEPDAQARALETMGVPIAGRITAPGTLEGGDLVWWDERTVLVGLGYRTNAEGICQLRTLVGRAIDVLEVPLPHWRGERDVMHLMSLISPVDRDAAVVYSPLLPVPFRRWLLERGVRLIEVPDDEFDTMGTNVLALAPGRCLVLSGNPRTRAELERAGIEVVEYAGTEISAKGAGGPTCLTRPLAREAG